MSNPWITAKVPLEAEARTPTGKRKSHHVAAERSYVLPGDPAGRLPQWSVPSSRNVPWWWTGCHGGAGVSSLAATIPAGIDAGRRWPVPTDDSASRVLLVARSHAPGLRAAQGAARQWASGTIPQVHLLGLVVVADAPGTLPRPLRDLLRLLTGAFPAIWTVPWIEEWRFGTASPSHSPASLSRLAKALLTYVGKN
ncbi:DUF6668 family protein [Embleya hyalina]|uniref:DUF6668 family protein n=1 Tax=Embleya hyalina TaxID=516124 RepID=UPI0035309FEC